MNIQLPEWFDDEFDALDQRYLYYGGMPAIGNSREEWDEYHAGLHRALLFRSLCHLARGEVWTLQGAVPNGGVDRARGCYVPCFECAEDIAETPLARSAFDNVNHSALEICKTHRQNPAEARRRFLPIENLIRLLLATTADAAQCQEADRLGLDIRTVSATDREGLVANANVLVHQSTTTLLTFEHGRPAATGAGNIPATPPPVDDTLF